MADRPLRLLIMNRTFDGVIGGVEKMSVALANTMAMRGHNVHMLSLDRPDASMYFPLDDHVRWHKISSVSAQRKAGWNERFRRMVSIRRIMRDHEVDVAIGFQDGAYLSLLTASPFLKAKIVAAERNSPSRFDFLSSKKAKYIAFASFRFADAVTVQCPSYVSKYPQALRKKIQAIPNPVLPAQSYADAAGADKAVKTLLYVGRFDYQKNLATLVRAFASLAQDFPDWQLKLVGKGADEKALRSIIEKERLEQRILISGATSEVQNEYVASHLFCLPSLWEGFPNVLAEAMAHGLPCVGFQKCDGVNDLIEDNYNGTLTQGALNDHEALAKTLSTIMASPETRSSMGAAAILSVKAYEPEKVFDQWERFFRRLAVS